MTKKQKPAKSKSPRNMQDAYLSLHQALKRQIKALEARVAALEKSDNNRLSL